MNRKPDVAAYVHIPFCVRKCTYCDFCSYPGQSPEKRLAYCVALQREIAAVARAAGDGQPLDTVFFGGGTPTVLTGEQLAAQIVAIRNNFGLASDGEFTLEANPGTVTADGLRRCREAGFNRISFGLQAIQPALLAMLGRIHNRDDFAAGVAMATAAGFASINADIMFGLPGQTLDDVAATVDFLLTQPVDHVSFYSLSLEEGTPLHALCQRQPDLLPDEETERAQYRLIRQKLQAAGFEHYEISNAARPGHQCRHNLVYWQARPYYGFGVAAHSLLAGVRRGNTDDLDAYLAIWLPGGAGDRDAFAAATVLEIVDEAESRNEAMLLGLRLLKGVSFAEFNERFGVGLLECFGCEVESLRARGLVIVDDKCVRLSELGLDLANQVFMKFV